MAEKQEIIDNGLWAGTYGEQRYGDDLYKQVSPYTLRAGIKNAQLNQGALEKILANAQQQTSQNVTTSANNATNNLNTTNQISDFIANNKLLVFGGLALVAYFVFFSQGGGLSEVTTVRRYNKK